MLANFSMFFGGRDRDNPLGFVGAIAMMFLAPLAAMLVQMAISRTREYSADRGGAEICGNPLWLASGLEKISQGAAVIPNEAAEENPAMAHMFIINPLSGQRMDSLFSTHPDTQNRIAVLMKMAQGLKLSPDMMPDNMQRGQRHAGGWSPTAPKIRRRDDDRSGPWG